MQLNYCITNPKHLNTTIPIIIVHGLFGNLSNFKKIVTILSENNCIIPVDLRNHGNSPHDASMTYIDMAQDILELLDQLLIKKCIIIGHSMGGKVIMTLCMLASQRIKKIIVIDIAPIRYNMQRYHNIFAAIECINKFEIKDRITATQIMRKYISNQLLIGFLLKSFNRGIWKFNFLSIKNNCDNIGDWSIYTTWWGPALFIKGSRSTYLNSKNICDIYHQFPNARIYSILNAGHWVHYDNPIYMCDIIKKFIIY